MTPAWIYTKDGHIQGPATLPDSKRVTILSEACRLAIDSMKDALDGNNPGWMDNMRADLDFIEKSLAKASPSRS